MERCTYDAAYVNGAQYFFIEKQAFEALHEYSRSHEEWELDEIILVCTAIFFTLAVVGVFSSVILVRRIAGLVRVSLAQERQLAHSRKMQSMGNLLGGISHSLNNQLMPIITISKLMRDDADKNSELYTDISRIIEASESAKKMLKKVLKFAREGESIYEEKCDIVKVVSTTSELAKAGLPSKITLNTDLPQTEIWVGLSTVDIEVIVLNLIKNAVDAIGKQTGVISITVKYVQNDKGRNSVHLIVRDDGPGVPKQVKDRIFDPFFTTKGVNEGTGLGLSETYGLVTGVGGVISVDSTEGEYTQFNLLLPAVDKNT